MWIGIVVAGCILTAVAVAVYLTGLIYFVGTVDLTAIGDKINVECGGIAGQEPALSCEDSATAIGLTNARTAAFICVVWCENLRAYVARSFNRPVWEGALSNPAMQKAILLAQVALYIVILTPGLSTDIMSLDGMGLPAEGWVLGIGGSFGCLLLCEVYKPFVRKQMASYQRQVLREEQEREMQQMKQQLKSPRQSKEPRDPLALRASRELSREECRVTMSV